MPVFFEDIQFRAEEVALLTYTDYLKGNIFQKIFLKIICRSELWINLTATNGIKFQDTSFKTQDWISSPSTLNMFEGFNVDDEVDYAGTGVHVGRYLISEKLNNYQMRLTDTLGAAVVLTDQLETGGRFSLVQDPLGFTLDFGLIENSEALNFDSKVDQSLMRYELGVLSGSLPSALTPMLPVGKKDWQLGSCSLKNTSQPSDTDLFRYRFEFEQEIYIHPFYLPEQLDDLLNAFPIAPKYYRKEKCLRYVARLHAHRELQDPNVFQEGIIESKDGQTGGFGEEFNGGTPRFSHSNFTYVGSTINALDPRKVNSILFVVETDTSFFTGVPQWVTLNFIVLPEDDNDFKNRDQLQRENYVWDRSHAEQAVSPVAINGENFGTGYQVFKNVKVTAGINNATVTADIDFGADAIAKINTLKDGRYLIAAYTSFGNSETADSYHAVTMLLDVSKMETEITDGIVDVTTDILYHDQNDATISVTTPKIKVEDEIVAESLILIDHTPITGFPGSQIDKIRAEIVAKKTGEDDIVLLSQEFNLTGNPVIGPVRDLQESPVTGFNVSQGEIRHNFEAFRSRTDDSGTEYAYRVRFPFLYRWEYWEALNLAKPPNDWFDSAEDFNGFNNDWFRIQGLTGWDLYSRLSTDVTFLSTPKTINHDEIIVPLDYLGNADWSTTPPEIESYDGATKVSFATNPYIIENKNTTIKAKFTYTGGSLPATAADVYMVARLIPKEGGNYIANETLSSVYDRTFKGGIFIGDSAGKIVVTKSGSVFTGTFDIDFKNIPVGLLEYTLSVSININTIAAITDFGEIQKQDMKVLEIIDFNPAVVPKDEHPFKKCCYEFKVFGNIPNKTDKFRNDFRAPIKIFPLQYTVVTMKLEKLVSDVWTSQTTLTDDTYGEYHALGFESKNNRNYVGYTIDWVKVLDNAVDGFGAGKYRINFFTTSGSFYSHEFCLSQFTLFAADNTVRINYGWDSLIGDEDQKRTRDFVGFDWQNQIRIDNALFGKMTAAVETESVRYQNGEEVSVSKSFDQKFELEFKILPDYQLNLILFDVLMADSIEISDYNRANFTDYSDYSIEIDGSVEPNYDNNRPQVSATLSFKSKFKNNNKYFS